MTLGILIGPPPTTLGQAFVEETARLVVDRLILSPTAKGTADLVFGEADQAIADRLGALYVPIETIGLGARAALPAGVAHSSAPVRAICLHGPESTGKSVMAERLADRFGSIWVPEYGRAHCELHGTDLDEAGLLLIGRVQDAMTRASLRRADRLLFVDTDPLMTAAWCAMMIGHMPDALFGYSKADLYLMLEPDVAWQRDGVRIYGAEEERTRFAAVCRQVLDRAGVRWTRISGDWDARVAGAAEAIEAINVRLGGPAGL